MFTAQSHAILITEVARLRTENEALQNKLHATTMHANMARLDNEDLHKIHYSKTFKKPVLSTVTSATGWLTSQQGKELHQQHKVIRGEKRQKKDEKAARMAQEQLETQRRRQGLVI